MGEGLTGIYAIANNDSGKVYVGSTATSFKKRWAEHRAGLRGNYHHNSHLQAAWARYGEGAFEFVICEYVDDPDRLIEREQYWLDKFRLMCAVYNMGVVAACPILGMTFSLSEETRRRISAALVGNSRRAGLYPCFIHRDTKEVIPAGANLAAMCRERGLSYVGMDDVKSRRTFHHKGWEILDESLRKIKMPRKPVSKAGRAAVSRSKSGASHPNWGKCLSEKTKARIGESNAGEYPAFVRRETREVIPAGRNLSKMCRERGLRQACMSLVVHGHQRSHQGWALLPQ